MKCHLKTSNVYGVAFAWLISMANEAMLFLRDWHGRKKKKNDHVHLGAFLSASALYLRNTSHACLNVWAHLVAHVGCVGPRLSVQELRLACSFVGMCRWAVPCALRCVPACPGQVTLTVPEILAACPRCHIAIRGAATNETNYLRPKQPPSHRPPSLHTPHPLPQGLCPTRRLCS